VTKLSLLVCALFAVGCKGKAGEEKPARTAPVVTEKPALAYPDMAAVEGPGPKLMLETVSGAVMIDSKGAIQIGSVETNPGKPTIIVTKSDITIDGKTTSTPSSTLPSLAKDLGLPEVTKRRPSAFGAEGAAGSGSGSGSGSDATANPTDVQFSQLGHPEPATSVPVQAPRLSSAFAIAHPFDVSAGVVVFADAKAPATSLVDVLAITGGFIAVKRGTELGALPFAFDRQEPPFAAPNRPWLELRLGKPSVLAVVPGLPMPSDMNKLPEVIKASGMKALDILVAADSTVADVVAAAELERSAGIDAIGLGRIGAPNTPETMTRDYAGPRVLAWDFFMQNMDKTDPTPFHAALDATLQPVHACYEKEVAKAKDLGGVGRVELVVETTGKVADLQATGIPKPLAACAGAALAKAVFPPVATPVKITAQLAFVPH
jgi:hypothetical protein